MPMNHYLSFLLNHKSLDLLTAYQGLCTNFTPSHIIPSSCHLTFKRRRLYSTISAMRLTFLNHFLTQTNQT